MNNLPDINTEEHVQFLVRTFYGRVLKDELMAPHFAHVNFEEHFPRMDAFWNFILLDKAGYTGNAFDKHVNLQIDERHYDRWLFHFTNVVDDFFAGEKATFAKQRAELLRLTFLNKLKK